MMTDFTTEDMRDLIRQEIKKAIASTFTPSPADELIPRKEAAQGLGVKENTLAVWAMQNRGQAPTKIGSRSMYRRSVIFRFIEENTMPREEEKL